MPCECNPLIKNTGVPACQALADVTSKLYKVPLKNSSGGLNRIDLSALPNEAAIEALINAADDRDRIYPFPTMQTVTDVREENKYQEFDSGVKKFLRKGTKSFSGLCLKQGPVFAGQIDSSRCEEFGFYVIDLSGGMGVDTSKDDGYGYPIRVDNQSFSAVPLGTTDSTLPMVKIDFQWDLSLDDADIGFITAGSFPSDVNLLTYNGLLDLNGAVSSIATTGFTMVITNIYGSAGNKQPVEGLIASDFDFNEVTPTPAPEPFSVIETATAGTYNFTITTPAASTETFSLGIKSTTLGFDDTNLEAVVILIP